MDEGKAEAKNCGASVDIGLADRFLPGPSKRKALQEKIVSLRHQFEAVETCILEFEKKKIEVQDELDTSRKLLRSILLGPGRKIIGFVKAIEKGEQYLDFMDYLRQRQDIKHNDDEFLTFKRLVLHERVQENYDKLNYDDIMSAIHDHLFARDYTLSEVETGGGQMQKNLIVNLVFRARQGVYVMDQDPLVELDLLQKSNPILYEHSFIWVLLRNYSEKMVRVLNVPNSYGESELEVIFSPCGKVESVKFESCNQWYKDAQVTFTNSEGAKLAPIILGDDGHCLTILPQLESPDCRLPTRAEVFAAQKKYRVIRNVYEIRRIRREQLKIRALGACPGDVSTYQSDQAVTGRCQHISE